MTHNVATRQVVENIGGEAIDTATEPRATRTAVLHHVYTSNATVTVVAGEVFGDKSGSKTAQQLYADKRRKARGDRSPTGGEKGSSTAACGVDCDKRALGVCNLRTRTPDSKPHLSNVTAASKLQHTPGTADRMLVLSLSLRCHT